jgi:hypothetical protein
LVLVGLSVELELTPHRVADPSFQTAEGFSAALAFSEFASEVGTAGVVVSDLGDCSDVDGMVQPPVPRSVESVPVLISRRHCDRSRSGVAGEVVPCGEPGYVTDFSEDEPGADSAHPIDPGHGGP